MIRLFRQFILRHLVNEKIRTFVTVLGIALGIAVVIAIQLTNASSLRGFEKAIETVSGKTSLEITGTGVGLDEMRLNELNWLREYGRISPVIEGDAEIETGPELSETMRVLGVDVLRDRSFREYKILEFAEQRRDPRPDEFLTLLLDPRSIILTERFAERHSLKVNDQVLMTFSDRRELYRIRGLLKNEGPARAMDGNFVLMDIAAAQLAFNRLGLDNRGQMFPTILLLDEGQHEWKEGKGANTSKNRVVMFMPLKMKELRETLARLVPLSTSEVDR